MAFRPSRRRRRKVEVSTELTLTPVMNLFMCMIPLLLMVAVFQKVSILNLYLPTVEEASLSAPGSDSADFTLAVTLTPGELSLRRDDKVLFRSSLSGGQVDLPGLTAALSRVKDSAPGKKDIILMIDGAVLYDNIIQVMDAARAQGNRELFSDISLADRVVEVR